MQKYKTLDNSAGVGFDLTLLIMLIQEKLLAGLSRVSISLQKYFMAYLRNSISRLTLVSTEPQLWLQHT